MTARISIRLRLTAWYSAVLLLGLILFGAGLWFAVEHRLIAGVDGRLTQEVQGVRTVLEVEEIAKDPGRLRQELEEYAKEVPGGTLIQLWDSSGKVLLDPPGVPLEAAPLAAGRPAHRTIVRGRRTYRVLTGRFEYGGQVYPVLVAAPLDEVRAVLRDLRRLLLTMIPGVLIVACLGGYWISRRALAPVDEITRVARSISVQNLSRRLSVSRTGDEIQRMSETWNEVLERLEASVKRIRQFTADASHELRTPVALIRATAELALRREREPEEYRKSLREIESEAERMTELTEALLALARADSNGFEMPLAPTDLNALAAGVVKQNQALAGSRRIHLVPELLANPALAMANEAGVRRLLLILIDNALKNTPAGGHVTVSTAACEGGISLAVRDSGEGIDPEALPHIFERFYRADKSRGAHGGAGLGLSIAQLIAQAHGAKVEVESTPGAGSCFHLTLPA